MKEASKKMTTTRDADEKVVATAIEVVYESDEVCRLESLKWLLAPVLAAIIGIVTVCIQSENHDAALAGQKLNHESELASQAEMHSAVQRREYLDLAVGILKDAKSFHPQDFILRRIAVAIMKDPSGFKLSKEDEQALIYGPRRVVQAVATAKGECWIGRYAGNGWGHINFKHATNGFAFAPESLQAGDVLTCREATYMYVEGDVLQVPVGATVKLTSTVNNRGGDNIWAQVEVTAVP